MADMVTRDASSSTRSSSYQTQKPLVSNAIETTHKIHMLEAEMRKLALRCASKKVVNLQSSSSVITAEELVSGILIIPEKTPMGTIYTLPSYQSLINARDIRSLDITIRNDSPHIIEIRDNCSSAKINGVNKVEGPAGSHWTICSDNGFYTLVRNI